MEKSGKCVQVKIKARYVSIFQDKKYCDSFAEPKFHTQVMSVMSFVICTQTPITWLSLGPITAVDIQLFRLLSSSLPKVDSIYDISDSLPLALFFVYPSLPEFQFCCVLMCVCEAVLVIIQLRVITLKLYRLLGYPIWFYMIRAKIN